MTTVLKQRQSTGDRGGLLTGPPRPAHPPTRAQICRPSHSVD